MPVRELRFDTRRVDASGVVYYECLCAAIFYSPQGFGGHTNGCSVWRALTRAMFSPNTGLRVLLQRRYEEGMRAGRYSCTRPHNSREWRNQYRRTNPRPTAAPSREARRSERRGGWLTGYQAGYSDGFSNSEEQTEAPDSIRRRDYG